MRTSRAALTSVPRALVAALLLAFALGACAEPSAPTAGQAPGASQAPTTLPGQQAVLGSPGGSAASATQPPGPGTVVVTPSHAARPVSVPAGGRLEFVLGPPGAVPWQLGPYPPKLLRLLGSDPHQGRWLFLTQARGQGTVQLRNTDPCHPPRMCPVAGDPTDGVHGRFPDAGPRFVVVVR